MGQTKRGEGDEESGHLGGAIPWREDALLPPARSLHTMDLLRVLAAGCGPSCFGQGSFFSSSRRNYHILVPLFILTTTKKRSKQHQNFSPKNSKTSIAKAKRERSAALTDNQNVDCLLALHVTLNGLNVHVLAKIYRLSRRRTLGSGTPGRPISRYSGGLDSSTACYGGRGE